jgi:hypothetical protein
LELSGASAAEAYAVDDVIEPHCESKDRTCLKSAASASCYDALPADDVEKHVDSPMSIVLQKVPSTVAGPTRAWLMTIPSVIFGASGEWGRLRDAHVSFEPTRMVITAHNQRGRSKIMVCDIEVIPACLHVDSSTYKVDPEGKSLQIIMKAVAQDEVAEGGWRKENDDPGIMEKDIVEGKRYPVAFESNIDSNEGNLIRLAYSCKMYLPSWLLSIIGAPLHGYSRVPSSPWDFL